MEDPQEVHLSKNETAVKESNFLEGNGFRAPKNESTMRRKKVYYRWFRIAIHIALVLVCGSAALLLGRLYYEKGGKSKWMGTAQAIPTWIWYLPVSTYSLICSSQLAFNAFFSYFLNSHKFTPYIINSLALLTISSTLLVFQNESSDDSDSTQISKKKYVVGFMCTVAASAGYGLWLSLTQLVFKKVIKRETFKVIMDMIIYTFLVGTCATLVGLFASGEWKGLKNEMKEYEMGKASYVLNLTSTAIFWQLFTIGCLGLISEVSSLFCNAITVLRVPLVPMLAVIFFHDKMHGVKVISMVLAIWGIISYLYQQYLDDTKSENRNTSNVPKPSAPLDEVNK
ncbi:unnamed protein product [Sphenostylis stenocarpa]|uniref:Probable purine permease n=1 Tax=Sphenostylis stenocarpa TaxID=92480 RepID=A0AA86SL05_9FABA|nr:unnamed protein product [Sphenostylis stenocarpa]